MPLSEAPERGAITNEEAETFMKHFQDPKFRELFEEYAREISDPKARAEHDAYLAQIEAEGPTEAIYGKGVQLIVPEAGMVIKTKDTTGKIRVYINVCTSSKIEKFSQQADPSRPGVHLSLPSALHSKQPRTSSATDGGTLHVWDLAVHPAALQQAAFSPAFMDTLVVMAIERVEDVSGTKLMRQYKLPKLKYKSVEGHEKPSVMSVRTGDGGDVVDGRIRPKTEAETGFQQAAVSSGSNGSSLGGQSSNTGPTQQNGNRSSFSFSKSNKAADTQPKAPLAANPSSAGYHHVSGAVTPVWELIERGGVDLGQAWQDRGLGPVTRTPQALVLRVQLPGVMSAAAVQLDVSSDALRLEVPGKYLLQLQLKYAVKDQEGTAKFDKSKQQLTVTMPVVQPDRARQQPPQEQLQLVTPMDSSTVEEHQAEQGQQQQQDMGKVEFNQPLKLEQQKPECIARGSDQPPAAAVSTGHQTNAAEGQPSSGLSGQVPDATAVLTVVPSTQGNSQAGKSANQLRWEQLHSAKDSEQQEQDQRPAALDQQEQQQDQHQQETAAAPKQAVQQQQPVVGVLKPRLQSRRVTASMFD